MNPKKTQRVVDVWAQPCNASFLRKMPEVRRLFEQSGAVDALERADSDPNFSVSPPEFISLMDEAGIDKVFMSAWCKPDGWVVTNDEIAEFVSFNRERLIGLL